MRIVHVTAPVHCVPKQHLYTAHIELRMNRTGPLSNASVKRTSAAYLRKVGNGQLRFLPFHGKQKPTRASKLTEHANCDGRVYRLIEQALNHTTAIRC